MPLPRIPPIPGRESTAGPLSFREFVDRVRPGYRWHRHCRILAAVLQRVADGELSRVMIFLPPREGKSELVSRLFSAYYLYRYPERWVGLTSYGAELAYTLSRAARDNYREAGGAIRDDAEAVKHWETTAGGGLWAAGVGGPITGKGFHLGIIDDPIKNAEEAASATTRERQKEWYGSTFYTRESTDAGTAIVLVLTRWNQDDLAGWLLAQESDSEGDEPERWHVVSYEAIKEATPPEIPATCTLEPDWREPGEALCPERRPVEKLRKIARRIGSYFWNALFQQRPRPAEGKLFKRAWFEGRVIPALECPGLVEVVRSWDLAATVEAPGTDPDWTVGVAVGKTAGDEPRFVVLDVTRLRGTPAEVDRLIVDTARDDRRRFMQFSRVRIPQDPGAAGVHAAHTIVRKLAGFDVRAERPIGSKQERARIIATQAEVGNLDLIDGPWVRDLIEELVAFPTPGVHDDQVDALGDGIAELTETYSAGAF